MRANPIAKAVRTSQYRQRRETAKKGGGSFKRTQKHKGRREEH